MIRQKKKPIFLAMSLGIALVFCLAVTGLTDAEPLSRPQTPEQTQTSEKARDGEILIQGQTVDREDKPLPNTKLFFSLDKVSSSESTVVSDAQGKFRYSCPEKDVSRLQVVAVSEDNSAYAPSKDWELLKKFGAPDEVKLYLLTPRKKIREITGTVVNAKGRPVEGAIVGGTGEAVCLTHVTTDAEGKFRFFVPGKGPLSWIFAIKPGFGFVHITTEESYFWTGRTPNEKISNGPFRLVFSKSQTVEVKVVDEKGIPVPGVTVTPDIILVEKKNLVTWFSPGELQPPVFYPQTGKDGMVRFDWIPTKDLHKLRFKIETPEKFIALPDGESSRLFGGPVYTYWNPEEKPTILTLPHGAKVNVKVSKPDGTPAADYWFHANWIRNGDRIDKATVTTNENGEAEIFAAVGDRLDVFPTYHRHYSSDDKLVFLAIRDFQVGDGSREKDIDIRLQPGAKLLGTVYGPDGQPFDWLRKYLVYARPCGFDRDLFQYIDSKIRHDDSRATDIEKAQFQAILPPGEYEFEIEPTRAQSELHPKKRLGAKKQIKVTNQEEIEIELHLKPLPSWSAEK